MPKRKIEQYEHKDKKRVNNPPVGMVTPTTDPDMQEKKTYNHDPHIDPQLNWAGKKENLSFDVDTVSLHVHERIDTKSIIEPVKKYVDNSIQLPLFQEKKPLREAIEFYKHHQGWSNRLIAGDSLLVMNSLIEKEGMAGKFQMIYIDPPYGISYGSNFQPFVNKKDVKDRRDDDLSSEPEMIKAFRDTWELGIHSYLSYLRDRIRLSYDLLNDTGSIFLQISDDNVHHVREIMDEIFGASNFVSNIAFKTKIPLGTKLLAGVYDHIIWYAKDKSQLKYNKLFQKRKLEGDKEYSMVELPDGKRRSMTKDEKSNLNLLPKGSRVFKRMTLSSAGRTESCVFPYEFEGEIFNPIKNRSWKTNKAGMDKLKQENRLFKLGNTIYYVLYYDDFPIYELSNMWTDTTGGYTETKKYVVETSPKPIRRCMLMSTDPGDLILDPTCGSGTTAYVAEELGRRWITCDTSRIAINLAKQRLITSTFDYYELAYPTEGIGSGLLYNKASHITLGSIANNKQAHDETLYDRPLVNKNKVRISGPFTIEAVPAPYTKNSDKIHSKNRVSDNTIAKSGETLNQLEWKDELLKTGIRTKQGNLIEFSRIETMSGSKYIQAKGETKEDKPKKTLIVFGPKHAPLEQRLVELAWTEAKSFKPDILLFCAFQFDQEAAKDIDELTPDLAEMQLLKVQMNTDLLTGDLRKKRSNNESFWLVGQPDIKIHKFNDNKIKVEVLGFDYYNPKTGNVESGSKNNIAMWMLDTDYDERSLYPTQIFFPMSGQKDGWNKLAKNLKAEVDIEKVELFSGNTSLEFKPGKQIAVKIVDDRGIESFRILRF